MDEQNQLTPNEQTPDPDVPPVPETSTIPPIDQPSTTKPLPVRIPEVLLKKVDDDCVKRGIARSELVREILFAYYRNSALFANVGQVLEDKDREIKRLEELTVDLQQKLDTLELSVGVKDVLDTKGHTTKIIPNSRYSIELENDLLVAVNLACKSIMPTRTDFRKKLKHYSRLESDRT